MSGVVNPYDGSILFERVLKANLPTKTSGKKIFFVVNQPTDTVGEIWATNNEGTVVCYSVAVDVQTLNAAMEAFKKQLTNLTETDTSLLNKINDCLKKVIFMPEDTWVQTVDLTGIYKCTKWHNESIPSGLPDGQGTVITINYAGNYTNGWIKQFFISPHTKEIYTRTIMGTHDTGWDASAEIKISNAQMYNGWQNTNDDDWARVRICIRNNVMSFYIWGVTGTTPGTKAFDLPGYFPAFWANGEHFYISGREVYFRNTSVPTIVETWVI